MTLYLDTSSFVKLYVDEGGSDDVRALAERASVWTTSVVAFAETRASLARMRRDKKLTPAQYAEAKRAFIEDWQECVTVNVTDDLARSAGSLAEQYGLRGFDSIHLATFAQVLERSEDDEVEFSSFDERLSAAARKLS